jgi:hypothetical protein
VTRNRKIICWIIIITAVLLLWYLYNWGGNLLKPLAVKQIKELTGIRVDIENIRFKLSGKIGLEKIEIGPLLKQTPDNAILTARNLDAYFSPTSLLRLAPKLNRLRIEDFKLNAQYNNDTKQWNIATLKLPISPKKGGLFPELRFKRGEIKFTQVSGGKEAETIACRIQNGNMRTKRKGDLYTLTIAEDDATEKSGNRIFIRWTKNEKPEIKIEGYLPQLDLNLFGSKCNLNSFNSKIIADKNDIILENADIAIGPQTIIDFNGNKKY